MLKRVILLPSFRSQTYDHTKLQLPFTALNGTIGNRKEQQGTQRNCREQKGTITKTNQQTERKALVSELKENSSAHLFRLQVHIRHQQFHLTKNQRSRVLTITSSRVAVIFFQSFIILLGAGRTYKGKGGGGPAKPAEQWRLP